VAIEVQHALYDIARCFLPNVYVSLAFLTSDEDITFVGGERAKPCYEAVSFTLCRHSAQHYAHFGKPHRKDPLRSPEYRFAERDREKICQTRQPCEPIFGVTTKQFVTPLSRQQDFNGISS
jgi:hypothetical protein